MLVAQEAISGPLTFWIWNLPFYTNKLLFSHFRENHFFTLVFASNAVFSYSPTLSLYFFNPLDDALQLLRSWKTVFDECSMISLLFHFDDFSSKLPPKLNSTTVLAFHDLWRRLGNHLALPCLDFGGCGSLSAPWPPFSRLWLSRLSPQQNLYFYTMKLSKWRPRSAPSRVPFFSDGLFRSMKSIISAFPLKRIQKQLMPNHHFCVINLRNC